MVGAELPLGDPQRPLRVRAGLGGLAQLPQDLTEVVGGPQGLGVVGAELPLGDPQRLLEVRAGLGGLAQLPQDLTEVVGGLQGLGVVGAELPLGDPQRLLRVGSGLGRIACRCKGNHQGIESIDDPLVVFGESFPGYGQGQLMGFARVGVQSAFTLIGTC